MASLEEKVRSIYEVSKCYVRWCLADFAALLGKRELNIQRARLRRKTTISPSFHALMKAYSHGISLSATEMARKLLVWKEDSEASAGRYDMDYK